MESLGDLSKLLELDLDYTNYSQLYDLSVKYPEGFWDYCAKKYLTWFKEYNQVYNNHNIAFPIEPHREQTFKWFNNGKLNACYNCLDRHLENHADKTAYYWQGDKLEHEQKVTYKELFHKVCIFSNVLKQIGIQKGDKVCIYLPMSIEAITAMLACARIGAIHTVVFAGFSGHAMGGRIIDAECSLLITTESTQRGGKTIPLFSYTQDCLDYLNQNNYKLNSLLLIDTYYSTDSKDFSNRYASCLEKVSSAIFNFNNIATTVDSHCEPVWLDSEDPLFILYTSGSTGKPKGVLHSTAGYLLHTILSFNKLMGINKTKYPDDVYWSSADIGWVAGHSYVLYGALGNAMTSVIFSGTPNYPDYDIFWKIIDKYKVSVFYTAPTAIRALMGAGDEYLLSSSRESLRLLATVGEPINPEAWQWYFDKVGKSKTPVIDTWWQTETGAAMLSPLPHLDVKKPGCAMLPFLGIDLAIIDEHRQKLSNGEVGNLVVTKPWPGMMRTVYNNHDKFIETYFMPFQGYFYTGDLAKRDQDGHYWLLGRGDDVINIAGHRFGTAEIESALVSHSAIAEAAVIPVDDAVKGHVLIAFVVFTRGLKAEPKDLIKHVREEIGPIVIFKDIKIVQGLPKTRSGKIMRRILKSLIAGETEKLGDISTLINPEVISEIVKVI